MLCTPDSAYVTVLKTTTRASCSKPTTDLRTPGRKQSTHKHSWLRWAAALYRNMHRTVLRGPSHAGSLCSGLRASPQRPALRHPQRAPVGVAHRRSMAHSAAAAESTKSVTAADLAFPPPDVFLLAGHEAGSFAADTISRRLPGILDGVISDLKLEPSSTPEEAQQLQAAMQAVEQLKGDLVSNAALTPLQPPPSASQQLQQVVDSTNHALDIWRQHTNTTTTTSSSFTWLGLPWLLVECNMYLRLHAALHSQPTLAARGYDPFKRQKEAALQQSLRSVVEVGATVLDLVRQAEQLRSAAGSSSSPGTLAHLSEAMQFALWGNKTDLSLFSVDSLGSSSMTTTALKDAAAAGSSNNSNTAAGASTSTGSSQGVNTGPLLVDETPKLWQHLSKQPAGGSHMHLVLDNSGLELFTDLCLAEYLLSSGLASHITLHGKVVPYFVSDTLQQDLDHLIAVCSQQQAPEGLPADLTGAWGSIRALASRWQQRLTAGTMVYTAPGYWTTPYPFWWMGQLDQQLFDQLRDSPLVIFKGDLNYRKLVFDGRWKFTEKFSAALGPFTAVKVLSLRTLKADTIAGLAAGQGEAVKQLDVNWQVNGKFGVVQVNV